MERRRDDDPDQNVRYFRSERLYRINGEYFFAAREGEMGPYPTESATHKAIDSYCTEMAELAHWQKLREQGSQEVKPTVHTPMELELVPMEAAKSADNG